MQRPKESALQKLKILIDALLNGKQQESLSKEVVNELLQQMSDLKDGQK